MAEFKDANTGDVLVHYVEEIADAVCGDSAQSGTGDRIRSAMGRIAAHLKDNPPATRAENQAASTATTGSGVAADLNDLIIKLKEAGVMNPDTFTLEFAAVTEADHADRQYNTSKIASVEESEGTITITLSEGVKVADLKNFDGENGWGVHKWLGIGVSAGINPITGLKYNGQLLGAGDVSEATACGLSAGYFVRWVAADLVLAGDETQKSKGFFALKADGYAETKYALKIVEG